MPQQKWKVQKNAKCNEKKESQAQQCRTEER
jgi:hypothetical protein